MESAFLDEIGIFAPSLSLQVSHVRSGGKGPQVKPKTRGLFRKMSREMGFFGKIHFVTFIMYLPLRE